MFPRMTDTSGVSTDTASVNVARTEEDVRTTLMLLDPCASVRHCITLEETHSVDPQLVPPTLILPVASSLPPPEINISRVPPLRQFTANAPLTPSSAPYDAPSVIDPRSSPLVTTATPLPRTWLDVLQCTDEAETHDDCSQA
eukprot:1918969-Rhodomonas_salina.3